MAILYTHFEIDPGDQMIRPGRKPGSAHETYCRSSDPLCEQDGKNEAVRSGKVNIRLQAEYLQF